MSQSIFGGAVRLDWGNGFRGANRIIDQWIAETAGELYKTSVITWRIVAATADQRNQPAISFDAKRSVLDSANRRP